MARTARSRWVSLYPAALGAVIGSLLVGLALPFAVGERPVAVSSTPADGMPSGGVTSGTPAPATGGGAQAGAAVTLPSGEAAPAPGASTAAGPASRAAGAVTATGRGVTATEVRIGILLLDIGGAASALGFGVPGLDPREQQEDWQVFVDKLNAEGGIAQRKVVPVYRAYDPTNADDMRATCIFMAEDAEVFAVLSTGGYSSDGQLCLVREHAMPFLSTQGQAEEVYRHGLAFTWGMSRERILRNQALLLHRRGLLRGKVIGVVDADEAAVKGPVERSLLPELQRLGYQVAHRSTLSPSTFTAASQIPVEISQMQSKRVDFVLLGLANVPIAQWVNEADARGFRPRYGLSDFINGVNDVTLGLLPRSFDGVGVTSLRIGETRVGRPLAGADQACLDHYAKATGRRPAPDDTRFNILQIACGALGQVRDAAARAGTQLTVPRFTSGLRELGTLDIPTQSPGSWQRKFDAADFVRTARADMECPCWVPVDEFVPAE